MTKEEEGELMESVNEKDYKKIMDMVSFISREHIIFSKSFLDIQNNPYNLKSKQLRHFMMGNTEEGTVDIQIEFLQYILHYLDSLSDYITYELLLKLVEEKVDYDHIREKNKDSIISKLFHYRYSKQEEGSTATNKCLNDLMGFRIYIDHIEDYDIFSDEIKSTIGTKDENENRFKTYNACKHEYKALHIYFNGAGNKYFPWELQIWDKKCAATNLKSHKEHKLGYLEWKSYAPDDIIEILER